MSSMGDGGDVFSLGGELLELVEVLLLLLLLLGVLVVVVLLLTCWLRRLVCCSRRDWILLLPSALGTHRYSRSKDGQNVSIKTLYKLL